MSSRNSFEADVCGKCARTPAKRKIEVQALRYRVAGSAGVGKVSPVPEGYTLP